MRDKLTFYNYFNNGDIFFSRIVLMPFIKDYDINFYHKKPQGLFKDIDCVNENSHIPENYDWEKNHIFTSEDIKNTPINCWLAQTVIGRGEPFQNTPFPGCVFENYVKMSKEISSLFKLQVYETEDYLPTVNYGKLPLYSKIKKKLEEFKKKYKKIILISNGPVMSSQSVNFDFTPIIKRSVENFSNVLFITTEKTDLVGDNIIDVFDIVETERNILEISMISIFCDIIVGRASGPYCFSQVKENLLDPNKTFVCFCYNRYIASFYQDHKCKVSWSNDFDINSIYHKISETI